MSDLTADRETLRDDILDILDGVARYDDWSTSEMRGFRDDIMREVDAYVVSILADDEEGEYDRGYDAGRGDGYDEGRADGYDDGYDLGYTHGYNEGQEDKA